MSRQELIDEISSITEASLQLKVGEGLFYVEKLPETYDFNKVINMKGSRALGYLLSEREQVSGQQLGHRQVDDENKIGQRKLMYADLVVINNSVRDKPRKCRVQALCDTACSFELVLPGHKAHQLHLEVRRETMARGFGNVQSRMTIFSPLCVTIALLDPTSNEVIHRVADLIPAAMTAEYDASLLLPVHPGRFAGMECPKEDSSDVTLELSPVNKPRQEGIVPDCILGLDGFKKLCLKVDPLSSSLFPIVEDELIL